MIELTVALPMYRSAHIGWLALESLCNQTNIDFDWELIIVEEEAAAFGLERLKKYIPRLKKNRCSRLEYISLKNHIPLSRKWHMMAQKASDTRAFLLQGADDYSTALRLKETYDLFKADNDLIYSQVKEGLFYRIKDGKIIKFHFDLYDEAAKTHPGLFIKDSALNMAFSTKILKEVPGDNVHTSVDGWLFRGVSKVCESHGINFKGKWNDSLSWKKGFYTDGCNNVSQTRTHYYDTILPPFQKEPSVRNLLDVTTPQICAKLEAISRTAKERLSRPDAYENLIKSIKDDGVSFCRFRDFDYHRSNKFLFDLKKEDYEEKKLLFMRHDVDHDPTIAYRMALVENKLGVNSTYFILLSDAARKWFLDSRSREKNMSLIKEMQLMGHEIALHYDFIGDFFRDGKDLHENIEETLNVFRDLDIEIKGCASHGSGILKQYLIQEGRPHSGPDRYKFINYRVWNEIIEEEARTGKDEDRILFLNGKVMKTGETSLKDAQLDYESYFVKRDWYISDSGGNFWYVTKHGAETHQDPHANVAAFISDNMKKGSVLQMLVHPIWWRNVLPSRKI